MSEIFLTPLKCKQCGHSWLPRTPRPVECPNCKSRRWDEDEPEKKEDVAKAQ